MGERRKLEEGAVSITKEGIERVAKGY